MDGWADTWSTPNEDSIPWPDSDIHPTSLLACKKDDINNYIPPNSLKNECKLEDKNTSRPGHSSPYNILNRPTNEPKSNTPSHPQAHSLTDRKFYDEDLLDNPQRSHDKSYNKRYYHHSGSEVSSHHSRAQYYDRNYYSSSDNEASRSYERNTYNQDIDQKGRHSYANSPTYLKSRNFFFDDTNPDFLNRNKSDQSTQNNHEHGSSYKRSSLANAGSMLRNQENFNYLDACNTHLAKSARSYKELSRTSDPKSVQAKLSLLKNDSCDSGLQVGHKSLSSDTFDGGNKVNLVTNAHCSDSINNISGTNYSWDNCKEWDSNNIYSSASWEFEDLRLNKASSHIPTPLSNEYSLKKSPSYECNSINGFVNAIATLDPKPEMRERDKSKDSNNSIRQSNEKISHDADKDCSLVTNPQDISNDTCPSESWTTSSSVCFPDPWDQSTLEQSNKVSNFEKWNLTSNNSAQKKNTETFHTYDPSSSYNENEIFLQIHSSSSWNDDKSSMKKHHSSSNDYFDGENHSTSKIADAFKNEKGHAQYREKNDHCQTQVDYFSTTSNFGNNNLMKTQSPVHDFRTFISKNPNTLLLKKGANEQHNRAWDENDTVAYFKANEVPRFQRRDSNVYEREKNRKEHLYPGSNRENTFQTKDRDIFFNNVSKELPPSTVNKEFSWGHKDNESSWNDVGNESSSLNLDNGSPWGDVNDESSWEIPSKFSPQKEELPISLVESFNSKEQNSLNSALSFEYDNHNSISRNTDTLNSLSSKKDLNDTHLGKKNKISELSNDQDISHSNVNATQSYPPNKPLEYHNIETNSTFTNSISQSRCSTDGKSYKEISNSATSYKENLNTWNSSSPSIQSGFISGWGDLTWDENDDIANSSCTSESWGDFSMKTFTLATSSPCTFSIKNNPPNSSTSGTVHNDCSLSIHTTAGISSSHQDSNYSALNSSWSELNDFGSGDTNSWDTGANPSNTNFFSSLINSDTELLSLNVSPQHSAGLEKHSSQFSLLLLSVMENGSEVSIKEASSLLSKEFDDPQLEELLFKHCLNLIELKGLSRHINNPFYDRLYLLYLINEILISQSELFGGPIAFKLTGRCYLISIIIRRILVVAFDQTSELADGKMLLVKLLLVWKQGRYFDPQFIESLFELDEDHIREDLIQKKHDETFSMIKEAPLLQDDIFD